MFVCMNSESMLGGENSGEMLTIIMPFSKPEFYLNSGIPAVFGPGIPVGIPAGVVRNTSGMPATIPAEFRRNAGNSSGRIPARIPVECRQ